jgi:MinD-like ATPase involved in chromosome partitioning or flagellar assembly
VLLGLEPNEMKHTLNDYLWGKCELSEAAHDITSHLGIKSGGQIFLIPSSMKANDIARILKEGYDVGLLNDGF